MSLPATYKRAVFKEANGPLVVEETKLEQPGPQEVLVKVEACGVCYSDIYARMGAFGGGFPLAPGHEIVGRVAALGSNVSGWKVGERVGSGWHGGHDGSCGPCKKGLFQMCDNAAVNGQTKNGGFAEYVLLRAEACARVPDDADAASTAPLFCAGLAVFNSMRRQNVPVGQTVAIQGLGGLGHLAIQYAVKLGYRVVAISRGGEKRQYAKELGAHEYIDASQGDVGEALIKLGRAALVVTTNPSGELIPQLLKGIGPLGKLCILSVPGEIPIDTLTMLKYGVSVQVWPSGHATDSEETIAFSQLHKVDCMIEKFPLDRADDAFNAMLNNQVRFRAVITM